MTTLDNNFYKALGMIAPGSVELLMKTEPDVDKVLAALPEIDQKVVAGLKKYDQFDPALIYAIKAIVDKQKETRNFCAGWSAAQERAKAAKKIVDKINFAQTVDTHGVRIDGLEEHVAEQKTFKEEQKKTNNLIRKEVDACVDGHKATQHDVKEQSRAMDKVKHFVDGAIGQQSRMAETLQNELMGQRNERKELQGKTVEKAEAAAGLQQEVKMLAQLNDDNCKRLAASDDGRADNSLSELRNVIRKLAAKGKPTYRNSMLTKLLRPALSAGGKTLLIVNVSPTEESREETRGSLLFAQMSKEVELGKAKKNVGHA